MTRISADFCKYTQSPRNPEHVSLILTTIGTLGDLARYKIRLQEGMKLTFYTDSSEDEDLEVEGTVFYDPGSEFVQAPSWVADVVWDSIRDVPVHRSTGAASFPCFGCDLDLLPHFEIVGCGEHTVCPSCGTSVREPVAPPPSQ